MLLVLTVNVECDRCFVLLAFLHGPIEHDATIARTVVVLGGRDSHGARCLMVL